MLRADIINELAAVIKNIGADQAYRVMGGQEKLSNRDWVEFAISLIVTDFDKIIKDKPIFVQDFTGKMTRLDDSQKTESPPLDFCIEE